jgi:chitodextrinase
MKRVKVQRRRSIGRHHLPVVAHVIELVVGLVIIASGQNLFTELVGASPDITPPSVPSVVTMTGRTATDIALSWTASTDDTGVTGYHVYRNGSLVGTPATNSYDDTGLVPNTSYSYTVSAFDAAANESAQSSPPFSASTLADTSPPTIPNNLHQTGSTTSSISIAWDASTDNVGVTGYDIYRNGALIRSQSGTSFTDGGLSVYTSYTYTITAYDASNNASSLSQPLYGSTAQDITPPSVPDNIQKTGSTVTSVSLSWDASTDDVGVAGYHVYRDGNLVGSPGGTSFTDTGLTVSSSYTYTISAFDAAGNESAQSAPFSTSSSDDTTPPSTPTNVHTTTVLDGSISLAWTASTDDVGVTGYKIYRDGNLVGTSTTTSYTDNSLNPSTNYSYTIKAYDAANNVSPASAVLNTQTAYDTTPPSTPTNLVDSGKTDTSITLGWDFSTDNIGVTGYDIFRDGTLITSTTGTGYTDSGLAVDTSYTYTVRAHDGSGNDSDQSSPLITRTLPDQVPPTAPTNLASPSQTTTSIDLTWNAATDDVGVVSYNIYRGGVFIANVNGTSYTDSGLTYNTAYSYTVTALDNAGNESPVSTALAQNTLPDTTPPQVTLTAPGNGSSDSLTFGISATASDDLALSRVDFYADSTLIASITSAPFAFNWNSYAVHNGAHTITAKAYDASGNTASDAAAITINNPPPPLLGDLNGDHKVNLLDLSILLSNWNKPGLGDFNNNGKVDIFDLSVMLSHYGQDNSNYN